MSGWLTARQRTAPPYDRRTLRRGESAGGYDVTSPRTLAPGIDDELARYPGTVYDREVCRDRGPFYMRPQYVPPPVTWVNWTAAGPIRPELHMRNVTLREMQGDSNSRYPVIDSPTTGMHTMTEPGVRRTVQRYMRTPQITPGRQDRLSPGQYASQSYSQTTRLQGR